MAGRIVSRVTIELYSRACAKNVIVPLTDSCSKE
jgi:hypothetical protein